MKKKLTDLNVLNNSIFQAAYEIAVKIKAKALLIYMDSTEPEALDTLKELAGLIDIIIVTRKDETLQKLEGIVKNVLIVPNVNLTRVGQIKMAIMRSLSSSLIKSKDKIVCLSGIQRIGSIDNITIVDIGKEFELLTSSNIPEIEGKVKKETFEAVLNLAIEVANQGREGKAVGTIYVVGDHEKVLQLSRQMIFNPFKGYSEEERIILSGELKETLKEFATLDGAFIIRDDGVVVAAGRYLNASYENDEFPQGLGARHMAAAGITSVTDATAFVISQSTGTIRIFKKGTIFMEIEKSIK